VTGARFTGKVILVTGGSSGLGLAAARAFADEGAELVIAGRDQAGIDRAVAAIGAKATGHHADVSRVHEIAQLMQAVRARHGRLDVLFANAGIARLSTIADVTEALWDEVMNIDVRGLYFTVQQALPLMGNGASIVLNASVAAEIGAPEASVYAASKAAVRSLGRSLGAELVGRGIRVNVVSPGPIDTPIFDKFGIAAETVNEVKKSWADAIPMKRLGRAEEVARAVLFLASSEASYITGVELLVDGGRVSF
jgi:NAD(P)-dependent dehydrogenase (short-subunit alcohol dehydrogenase family)